MADIIIKTENLCFEYDENDGVKKHPVLRSMNLEIERGSFTAILGHTCKNNQHDTDTYLGQAVSFRKRDRHGKYDRR